MSNNVPCPLCKQEADKKAFIFEISRNENVKLELNLFDIFNHIEDLKQELRELSKLLAQHVFKEKGDHK